MRVYANCLGCGQQLVVPADDLQQTLTCPRCGKSQRVVDILDKSIALPPVLDGDVSKAQPALPGGFETGKLHADADTEPDAPAFDLPAEPVPHAESPRAHLVTPADSAGPLQPTTSAGGQSPDLLAVGSALEGEPPPTKVGIFAQLVLGLLRLSAILTERLRGKQLLVVGVGGAIVFGVGKLRMPVYVWLLPSYVFVLYLMLIGWLWSLQDEEGSWTLRHLGHRLKQMGNYALGREGGIRDDQNSLPDEPEDTKVSLWGKIKDWLAGRRPLSFAIGIVILVLLPPFELITGSSNSLLNWLAIIGGGFALLPMVSWALSWGRRHSNKAKDLFLSIQVDRSIPFQGLLASPGLPAGAFNVFQLDKSDIEAIENKGLSDLLKAFKAWRPHYHDNERGYQLALERFLRRRFRDSKVEREVPIGARHADLNGRLDLVLADCVAVELKKQMGEAEADRAIGQMRKYSSAWSKGPMVLLVTESRGNAAEARAAREITSTRTGEGHPVLFVAAGHRPR